MSLICDGNGAQLIAEQPAIHVSKPHATRLLPSPR
jgi:hypothetical protein